MTLPTIHDNGTSARMLLAAYDAAYEALGDARDKLKESAPNGRDYYVQPAGAFERATEEHMNRLRAIEGVRDELRELVVHCAKVRSK